jgi:hypothetical protein
MIGLAQKEGKICAWIDAEMSYDKSWAETWGRYIKVNCFTKPELLMKW